MKKTFITAGTALILSSLPALAQQEDRSWPRPGGIAVSLTGGAEFAVGGNLTNALSFDQPIPAFTSEGVPFTFDATGSTIVAEFDEIYGATTNAGLEFAYGITHSIEAFANATFQYATGGAPVIGNITSPTDDVLGGINASLSVFRGYRIEGGARYYFNEGDVLRPYVAVRGGVEFTNGNQISIDAANPFPTPAGAEQPPLIDIDSANFLSPSTLGIGGADIGIYYAFTDHLALAIEVGFRYISPIGTSDVGRLGTPLIDLDGSENRISIPFGGRLQYRF